MAEKTITITVSHFERALLEAWDVGHQAGVAETRVAHDLAERKRRMLREMMTEAEEYATPRDRPSNG